MVKFLDLQKINASVGEDLTKEFNDVLNSGWFVMGNKLVEFENKYALFSNTKHCIGVGNGLEAIEIALKSLGIKTGDEVIVPSNTYIATLIAVSNLGAVPVMVEPKINTYNIDAELIEAKISNRTKAIIPVHLYGQACEMDKILFLAKKHNLFIVEDNAQSQGAKYKNKITGSFGHANATSFYPGKNLGALGDGGAVTTDSDKINSTIRKIRNYGSSQKYINETIGKNSRLDELQAAFLLVKLKVLEKHNNERKLIAEEYNSHLGDISEIVTPYIETNSTSVYHQYIIRVSDRDDLQRFLSEKGVQTLIHYPIPPHLQEAYEKLGHKKGAFPIAEEIADTCLSLPIYPGMPKEDINKVIKTINDFYG